MIGVKDEKPSLTERIADKIAQWAQDPEADNLKYLKVKLGLEALLINITKAIIVYTVVLIIGIFWQVLVFNISYYLIRRFAGGYHLPDSFLCSVLSVVVFVSIPYLAIHYALPLYAIPIIYVVNGIIIYLFAPYVSKKNGDVYGDNRIKLRNQTLTICFILLGISLLIQNETFQTLLTLGATLASVLTIHFNRRKEGLS